MLGWEINRAALTAGRCGHRGHTFWDAAPLARDSRTTRRSTLAAVSTGWTSTERRLAPHHISLDAAMSRIHALDCAASSTSACPRSSSGALALGTGSAGARAVPCDAARIGRRSVFARVRLDREGTRPRAATACTRRSPPESVEWPLVLVVCRAKANEARAGP